MNTSADPLVRVVKGRLADEELAALTAVLLARAAGTPEHDPRLNQAQARWQRLERRPGYRSPVSWHN
ncbi:acyl-CoA carboxylase subunit epsilon [Streptacidiphilus sp. 4-A2]|nr:acyl-CoA carboxylase subunit epsilon [Streptacidiphilus sp. 4-A2]